MKPDSRFKSLDEDAPKVSVRFGGQSYRLPEGANLAAALLAAGVEVFGRTAQRGVGRAPFCMMGACFECRVVVDGVSRQACMMQVREGLDIRRAGQVQEGPYAAR